jgi:hypothetical protein
MNFIFFLLKKIFNRLKYEVNYSIVKFLVLNYQFKENKHRLIRKI